ncbi:uncharacterized protein [Ptychodera flava]|uniref:uncharacterized protein isoform X2 n=1 Tax=Ptychodera flava TaxID=63121 RepID=UPI00396A52B8
MAFSSVLQMYLGWANSILHEDGDIIDGFHQLRDGKVFCKLLDLLNGSSLRDQILDPANQDATVTVQAVLDHLLQKGVELKTNAKAIVDGELKGILDVMWALILHFTIHSQERSAYQRTVWTGKKYLLEWCSEELTDASFDANKTLTVNFSDNNYLSSLIYKCCPFEFYENNADKYVMNLTNALIEAEDKLGIKKSFLSPADVISGNSDDHALLLYLALLKRKTTQVMPLSNRTQSTVPFTSEDEVEDEEEAKEEKTEKIAENVKDGQTNETKSTKTLQDYLRSLDDIKNEGLELQDTTGENGNTSVTSVTSISENTIQDSDTELESSALEGEPLESSALEGDAIDSSALDSEPPRHSTPGIPENDIEANSPDEGLNEARKKLVETLLGVGDCEIITPETHQQKEKRKKFGSQERVSPALIRRTSTGSGDELLDVLEAIGQECNELRDELAESRKRERSLQFRLEESSKPGRASQEEKVISKLVQELEMLRSENRRLFREAASAKNESSHEKKSVEHLHRVAEKLQRELDNVKSENFALKFKERLKEVHDGQSPGLDESFPRQSSPLKHSQGTPNGDIENEIPHIEGLPDTTDVRELKQHLASAKYEGEVLRSKLDSTNTDMTAKLNQTFDDLKTTKEESQKMEQENKLLKMAAEATKVEMESIKSKLEHLQGALMEAEEKNSKLTSELEELRALFKSDSSPRKLQREVAILKEKLQLAEEDREILKQELRNYRVTKSILDSSSSYRDKYTRSGDSGGLHPIETVSRQPDDGDKQFTLPEDNVAIIPRLEIDGSEKFLSEKKHDYVSDPVPMATLSSRLDPEVSGRGHVDELPGTQYGSLERQEPAGRASHVRRHTLGEPVSMDTKGSNESIFRGRSLHPQQPRRTEPHSLRTRSLSPANPGTQPFRGHRSLPREPRYGSLDFATEPALKLGATSLPTRSSDDVRGHGSLPRQQRDYSTGRSSDAASSRRDGSGDRKKVKQSPGRTKASPGRGKRETPRGTEIDGLVRQTGDLKLDGKEDEFDDIESDGLSERSFRAEDFINEFSGSRTDRSNKRREVETWLKEEERPDSEYAEIGYLSLRNVVYGRLPTPDDPAPTENYADFSKLEDYTTATYGKLPNTVIPRSRQEKVVPASTVVPSTSSDVATTETASRKYRAGYTPMRSHTFGATPAKTTASTLQPYSTSTYTPVSTFTPYSSPYNSSAYKSAKLQTSSTYGALPNHTRASTYTRPTYTPATTSSSLKRSTTNTTYTSAATQAPARSHTSNPRNAGTSKYSTYGQEPSSTALKTVTRKYDSMEQSPRENLPRRTEPSGKIKYGYLPAEQGPPLTNGYSDYILKHDTVTGKSETTDLKEPERKGRRDTNDQSYNNRPPRSPHKSYRPSTPSKVNGSLEVNGYDSYSYYPKTQINTESPGKMSAVGSEISSNGPLSLSELQHSPQIKARNGYKPAVPTLHLNDDDTKKPANGKVWESGLTADSKFADLTFDAKAGDTKYAELPYASPRVSSVYDTCSKYESPKFEISKYSKLSEAYLTSDVPTKPSSVKEPI